MTRRQPRARWLAASALAGIVGCATMQWGVGTGPSPGARSSAERVGELTRNGELAEAVTEARKSADAARAHPDDKASLALSLQMLGLALAGADRSDEALGVAAELQGIPGTVSWMAIQAEVARRRCEFDKAADLYLQVRAKSPAGSNDAPTEGGLAAVDLDEGRTERAVERLEHALSLTRPASFPEETWSQVESALRRGLASAYARAGKRSAVAGKLTPADATLLRTSALHIADYALSEGRALHLAYESLANAILAGDATGAPDAGQRALRKRLDAVLAKYTTSGGACRDVIPDPLAEETPGARLRLSPPPPAPASTAATPAAATAPATAAVEPAADRDGDGIADSVDKCPDAAEVVNGVVDDDGCPDEAPGYMVGREIRPREQIQFARDSANIDPAAKPTLEWLARLLAVHREIRNVSIEGHTDDVGSNEYNLDLSRRRARAVLDALVALGVDASRLRSEGFGKSRPKLLGTDAAARTANRRVELIADLAMPPEPTPKSAPAEPVANAAPPPTANAAPAPAPAGSADAGLASDTGAPSAGATGTLVVKGASNPVELELSVDGKALPGPFTAQPDTDTSFSLPAGKIHWKHLDTNCDDEGDVSVPEMGSATLECWTSNHMGDCCQTGKLGAN